MKRFTITKSNFLDWYFSGSDQDIEKSHLSLAEKVISKLYENKNGAVITVEEIFIESNHEAIRLSIIEEFDDDGFDLVTNRELDDIELGELKYEWELTLID